VTKPSKYRYLRVVGVLTLFMGRVYTRPFSSKRSGRSATTKTVHLGEKNIKLAIRSKRRSLVSSEHFNTKLYIFKSHIRGGGGYGERNPHYAGRWLKASAGP
jgi:hypothetical protein